MGLGYGDNHINPMAVAARLGANATHGSHFFAYGVPSFPR